MNKVKSRANTGFTIVELLIVVVVIAILAAITVVSYNGITKRSKEAAIKTDISNFMKKIEIAKVESGDGLYPATPSSTMGFKANKSLYEIDRNNWYYCVSNDRTSYSLGVVGKGSGNAGYRAGSLYAPVWTSGVTDATTCAPVGKPNGSVMGLLWFTTQTNVWGDWL